MADDRNDKKPSRSEPGGEPAQDQETGERLIEVNDSSLPRFKPDAAPADSTPQSAWEPGVVEVEFKSEVRPQMPSEADAAGPPVMTSADVDISDLNQVLQQHNLMRAEPTFQAGALNLTDDAAPPDATPVTGRDNFVTLHFPDDADVVQISQELNQLPEVERAVPIPKALPPSTPLNEPLLGTSDQLAAPVGGLERQWYIFRCRVDGAWSISTGGGVVIADIDWGYRVTHQDIGPRLTKKYNSFDGGSHVSFGDVSHGTAVLGIAGAGDNDTGMAGIAFDSELWAIQANAGPGPAVPGNAWANAIDFVRLANSGGKRKVIILEVQTGNFGNYEMVPSVNKAIKDAIASGVVVCVAAGNGDRDAGIDDVGMPIPPTGSILVGATEFHPTQNRRASFSNFDSQVVVSAPGDSSHDLTCSSGADNGYRNGFGGTSGATPKVAGTVALMLAVNPNLSHQQIRGILRNTGSPVSTSASKPVGTFLNTEAAVREAQRLAQET